MDSMKETGVNDLGEIFSNFLNETFCPAGLAIPIISLPYHTILYDTMPHKYLVRYRSKYGPPITNTNYNTDSTVRTYVPLLIEHILDRVSFRLKRILIDLGHTYGRYAFSDIVGKDTSTGNVRMRCTYRTSTVATVAVQE